MGAKSQDKEQSKLSALTTLTSSNGVTSDSHVTVDFEEHGKCGKEIKRFIDNWLEHDLGRKKRYLSQWAGAGG